MSYHQQIKQLYSKVVPYVRKTPLLYSDYFSHKTQAKIFLKCENLQYTGSFKIRGALSKIFTLPDKTKTLITASGGNHGLGVCWAGKLFGMETEVILPRNTPSIKIEKIKSLGGKVVMCGEAWDEANAKALDLAKDSKYVYIHPFSDNSVIAGQATIAYELINEINDIDIIIASIGGGGLISGISQYAKSVNPKIRIYGVETAGADSMYQSIKANKIIELPTISSIAESLGAKKVTQKTFAIVKKYVNDVTQVPDVLAMETLLEILQQEKLLVEPAASCSLSAIINNQIPDIKGKKIAIILCGGNFPLNKLKTYIAD